MASIPSIAGATQCSGGTVSAGGSGPLTLHTRFGNEYWPAPMVRRRRWLDRASGLPRRRPGGCDMGSIGPTHLISLLIALAIIAAICGFLATAVVRRNKRRTRGFFLLGFFCGLMAGAILHGRRRGTDRFAARAVTFAASHIRLGMWPRQWQRQMSKPLLLRCGPSLGARQASIVSELAQRMSAAMANSLARPPR